MQRARVAPEHNDRHAPSTVDVCTAQRVESSRLVTRRLPFVVLLSLAFALWAFAGLVAARPRPDPHGATLAPPPVLLSPSGFRQKGLEMRAFSMITMSYDGSFLVGLERVADVRLKLRGIACELRVLHYASAHLVRVDTILLPTTAFEQLALSSDGRTALVIGEGGSKFILVNLVKCTARVIWTHRRGVPGFRCDQVAWWFNGAFYMVGYLHDSESRMVYNGIVRLNLARSGPAMFERALDLTPLERRFRAFCFQLFVDPAQCFFGCMPRMGQVDIYAGTSPIQKIASVVAVGGVAASHNRLLYAARLNGGQRDVILKDVETHQIWHLGRDNLPFNYLFLSLDGKTAVITLMNFRNNTMSYFYARQAQGFKLRPVPALQNVRPGTLRLAGNGSACTFFNPDGLLYVRLR